MKEKNHILSEISSPDSSKRLKAVKLLYSHDKDGDFCSQIYAKLAIDDDCEKVRQESIFRYGMIFRGTSNIKAGHFLFRLVANQSISTAERKIAYFSLIRILQKEPFIGQQDLEGALQKARNKVEIARHFFNFDVETDIDWQRISVFNPN